MSLTLILLLVFLTLEHNVVISVHVHINRAGILQTESSTLSLQKQQLSKPKLYTQLSTTQNPVYLDPVYYQHHLANGNYSSGQTGHNFHNYSRNFGQNPHQPFYGQQNLLGVLPQNYGGLPQLPQLPGGNPSGGGIGISGFPGSNIDPGLHPGLRPNLGYPNPNGYPNPIGYPNGNPKYPHHYYNYTTTTTATTGTGTGTGTGSGTSTGTGASYVGFMQSCTNDTMCDMKQITFLRCELNLCRCPFGRVDNQIGGIIVTSSWSHTLMKCEAILGSECNNLGGGLTCVNQQPCIQLSHRPTGIGCCGKGCKGTRTYLLSASTGKLYGNDFTPNFILLLAFSCSIYYINIEFFQKM